jgi:PKD repeat protein
MKLFDTVMRTMGSALSRWGVLLIDIVAPGLWQGRAFRVYHEFTANTVIQFIADTDFALDTQTLSVLAGEARVEILTGGTPGGTFTPLPTHFNKKLTSTPVAPTFIIGAGGTHTGGTQREVLSAVTSAGGQAVTAATESQGKRLLPAGTYYMRVTVTGTTRGMYAVEYDKL